MSILRKRVSTETKGGLDTMPVLFSEGIIGLLNLRSRWMRSATAERLANPRGIPMPQLPLLQTGLVRGSIGLSVSGYLYVSGKKNALPGMLAIDPDVCVDPLQQIARAMHTDGGQIPGQTNHEWMEPAPKIGPPLGKRLLSGLGQAGTTRCVATGGESARRCLKTGFAVVQTHSAKWPSGSQFLLLRINSRADERGRAMAGRMRFVREVCRKVRDGAEP